jgi:hypothetical protein
MINNVIKYLHGSRDVKLHYSKMDVDSLHLLLYTDASYKSRPDGSSQIGYVMLLADKSNICAVLSYSSSKCSRVVMSSFAAEALAFTEGFDIAFATRAEMTEILYMRIPILILMDSAALFDAIIRHRSTASGPQILDLHAARQSYLRCEIDNVGLIASRYNVADSLTKIKNLNSSVLALLRTHNINHPIKQFVVSPS